MEFDGVDEVERDDHHEDGVDHYSEPDSDDRDPSAREPVSLYAESATNPKASETVAANSAAHPPTSGHATAPTTAITVEATAV